MTPIHHQFSNDDLPGDAGFPCVADASGSSATPSDELSWAALQYVLGELSPAEEAVWEQRLLIDPEACTAVAEAVTLVQGLDFVIAENARQARRSVSSVATLDTPIRSRTLRRPGRKFLARSALSLLGVAALATSWAFWSTAEKSPSETEVAARLVGIWRSHASSSRPLGNLSPDVGDVYVWGDESEETELPGWLLAAVSLDSHPSDDSADWEEN